MKRAGTWAALLAAAGVAAGCGTTRVVLPAGNRMTPDEAVGVIERAARLNAEARVPAEAGAAEAAPAWADREGWFAWEEGRIARIQRYWKLDWTPFDGDPTEEELATALREAKEEAFNLRFQMATGQLDNNRRLRAVRRNIARIYTVLRERELGLAAGPDEDGAA